jgi:hypothetical protein
VGGVAPTASDDVVISSGATITIPTATTVTCRSLSVTGTGTLEFGGTTAQVDIGTTTPGTSNIAFTIDATAFIILTGTGVIRFTSTSTTQQTVTTNGKTMPNMSFIGAGSSYLLADNVTMTGATLTVTAGTFNTNSKNITCGTFLWTGSGTRTLTLGSSTITASSAGTALSGATRTNLTVTANTATLVMSGNGTCNAGGQNMNGTSLTMTANGSTTINGGGTFANVTYTPGAVKTATLTFAVSTTVTVTGTLTITGNSVTNRPLVQASLQNSAATINATAVSLSNADFQDITMSGTAGTGTSLGDCQGNTGFTFTTATTRYGVVAGNWSSTATWSTSSSGSGGASVPLPQDDVYLTSSSGAGTYTIDMLRAGKNLDCTGFTRSLVNGSSINACLYGSVKLSSSITWTNVSGSLTLFGRGSHTITMNGGTFNFNTGGGNLTINAPTGTYTLADALTMSSGTLNITQGTFNTAGYSLTVPSFVGSGTQTRSITLGTSTVTVSVAFTMTTTTGLTFSGASSTIALASSASARTFAGGNLTYGTLTYNVAGSTGALTISGSNSFDTINFSDATNARTLTLTASTTQTVRNAFNVNGTAGKLMTIAGATGTLSYTGSGVVSSDYLSISSSTATPSSTWYAGANSTDALGNSGWIFTVPPGSFIPLVVSMW